MSERTLTAEEATRLICAVRHREVAVLTMSAIAFWDDVRVDDYQLVGLMGGAGSIGLGLALGLPDRDVWVLDGDGSALMQLGLLPAAGRSGATNFCHIVFDNAIYAVSGGQPTPAPPDWGELFVAAGYASGQTVSSAADLRAALATDAAGPHGIAVRCVAERPDYPAGAFSVDPAAEAARVRAALE